MRVRVCCLASAAAGGLVANPISKVVEILQSLKAKVVKEGEAEQASFEQFGHFCKTESQEKQFDIRDGENQVEQLQATVEKSSARIEELESRIAKLAETVTSDENDLKRAKDIRKKEHDEYKDKAKSSMEIIDTLERAINTLGKVLKKGGSLVQVVKGNQLKEVTAVLSTLIDSAGLSSSDRAHLDALMQANDQGADSLGQAPEAAAYEQHEGSNAILEVLQDLLEKAETQKSQADKTEMNQRHESQLLQQNLEDQIASANKDMGSAKRGLAESKEVKANAEGDLESTQKELEEDRKTLADTKADCEEKAAEWKSSLDERNQEVKALEQAVAVIQDKAGGAENKAYGLLQTRTPPDGQALLAVLSKIEATGKVVHDRQLTALEVRVKAAASASADPFAKVKQLLTEMIGRLEAQASSESSHKAFCDKETLKSQMQKEDKSADVDSLSAKIAKAKATIAKRKEEVGALQKELAAIALTNKEMTDLRGKEHATFLQAEKDYSDGVDAVRKAIQILRDYYAEDAAESTGLLQAPAKGRAAPATLLAQAPRRPAAPAARATGLVQTQGTAAPGRKTGLVQTQGSAAPARQTGLVQTTTAGQHKKSDDVAGVVMHILEVAESDFAALLTQARENESESQRKFDELMEENKVATLTKKGGVKYKNREVTQLESTVSEQSNNLESTQDELDAVLDYISKLNAQCVAKPDSYEEKKRRREEEIQGLQEALQILEGDAIA